MTAVLSSPREQWLLARKEHPDLFAFEHLLIEPPLAKKGPAPILVIDRFWSNVAIGAPDECWPYMGPRVNGGYGRVTVRGGPGGEPWSDYAHRLAWLFSSGQIPADRFVCHRCDNPPCCNPAHLFTGTVQENHADMRAKGRSAKGDRHRSRTMPETIARGEAQYNARLTEDAIREIRRRADAGESQRRIGADFGVGQSRISAIKNRRSWRHVA